MAKIIGAIVIAAIGLLMFNHGTEMKSYEDNRGPLMFFGAVAQGGSLILLLYGLRKFFLSGIIDAIDTLARKDTKIKS